MTWRWSLALALLAMGGCKVGEKDENADRAEAVRAFPRADRAVSETDSNAFSTEVQRDKVNEAATVMDLAGIAEGSTVADIGAGEGYYTVRLAPRVGKKGRVVAQDIDKAALARLTARVEAQRLDRVFVQPGEPHDPRLPKDSFDRIFLVHMYHEVDEPYAFLWHLRPALRKGGKVIVVDVDRPTDQHGIPPALLFCEFTAAGFRLGQFVRKPALQGYYAEFEAAGNRPAPDAIRPCVTAKGKS